VGAGRFEIFDVERPSSTWWKEVIIRTAGAIAPLVVLMGVFTVANLVGGDAVPSTTVYVRPGPAQEAGMLDGDRVVEIDQRPIESWQELLGAVKGTHVTHEIVVERRGERVKLSVTPNQAGLIAIESKYDRRPVALTKALRTGLEGPFQIMQAMFSAFQPPKNAELVGPVGIVRETAKASSAGFGGFLWVLGILGSYFWPAFPILHVIDSVTLSRFQRKYPLKRADDAPVVTLETSRIARRRHALNSLLVIVTSFIVLWALFQLVGPGGSVVTGAGGLYSGTTMGAGAFLLPQVWLAPIFFPLTWLLAKSLWGPAKAVLVLVGLFVPCLNFFLLLLLSSQANDYMNDHGLANARA
jgi:hypothetical protein